MLDDDELVSAWRTGDRAAAEILFERHRRALYQFFRRRAGQQAEDLVQDTLLVCVRSRERFAGQSSFRTYVFAIAHRLLLRALARASRDGEREVDADAVGLAGAQGEPWSSERARLPAALAQLPAAERLIIELYFWHEMSGPEIARALGIPEPTARSRLRRALARLRVHFLGIETSVQRTTAGSKPHEAVVRKGAFDDAEDAARVRGGGRACNGQLAR
jgi:RNA polymerase sigma-70 factor (ECF subfamily)